MDLIVLFFIIMFIYMIIGIVDHLLNIYLFFKKDNENKNIEHKKIKLVE